MSGSNAYLYIVKNVPDLFFVFLFAELCNQSDAESPTASGELLRSPGQ